MLQSIWEPSSAWAASKSWLTSCCAYSCSFEFFDKDRTNSLNYEEISNALQHAGRFMLCAYAKPEQTESRLCAKLCAQFCVHISVAFICSGC